MAEENKNTENESIASEGEKSIILEESQTNTSQESTPTATEQKSETTEVTPEEFVEKKKKISLKKILIILIGFLVVLIITGVVIFILKGHKEVDNNSHETEKTETLTHDTQAVEEKHKEKEEPIKFEIKDLNSKKLNELFASLNNKTISQENKNEKNSETKVEEDENIQKERLILEEKRFELEKEKLRMEELKKDSTSKNESIKEEKAIEPQKAEQTQTESKEDNKNTQKEKEQAPQNNNIGKFISVVKIKGELKKKYLDKVVEVDPNLHLCRDDSNKIEIYYGPFNEDIKRDELFEKLVKKGFNQANKLELTTEEYNKRCNY